MVLCHFDGATRREISKNAFPKNISVYLCRKFFGLTKTPISQSFAQSPTLRKLRDTIAQYQESTQDDNRKIHVKGLVGSSLTFTISEVFKTVDSPFLLILNDKEEAAYILNDLELLIGENDVLFYP